MAFDNKYPNRKDHRKPYRRSKAFDRSCRPHGSCSYCEDNRLHCNKKRQLLADTDRVLTPEQMADEWYNITTPAAESVPLKHDIDESDVI